MIGSCGLLWGTSGLTSQAMVAPPTQVRIGFYRQANQLTQPAVPRAVKIPDGETAVDEVVSSPRESAQNQWLPQTSELNSWYGQLGGLLLVGLLIISLLIRRELKGGKRHATDAL